MLRAQHPQVARGVCVCCPCVFPRRFTFPVRGGGESIHIPATQLHAWWARSKRLAPHIRRAPRTYRPIQPIPGYGCLVWYDNRGVRAKIQINLCARTANECGTVCFPSCLWICGGKHHNKRMREFGTLTCGRECESVCVCELSFNLPEFVSRPYTRSESALLESINIAHMNAVKVMLHEGVNWCGWWSTSGNIYIRG